MSIQNNGYAAWWNQDERWDVILPNEFFVKKLCRKDKVAKNSHACITSHQGQVKIWQDKDMDDRRRYETHKSNQPLPRTIGLALLSSVFVITVILSVFFSVVCFAWRFFCQLVYEGAFLFKFLVAMRQFLQDKPELVNYWGSQIAYEG